MQERCSLLKPGRLIAGLGEAMAAVKPGWPADLWVPSSPPPSFHISVRGGGGQSLHNILHKVIVGMSKLLDCKAH